MRKTLISHKKSFTSIQFYYSLERKSGLVWTFQVPRRLLPRCLSPKFPGHTFLGRAVRWRLAKLVLIEIRFIDCGSHLRSSHVIRSVHGCSTYLCYARIYRLCNVTIIKLIYCHFYTHCWEATEAMTSKMPTFVSGSQYFRIFTMVSVLISKVILHPS